MKRKLLITILLILFVFVGCTKQKVDLSSWRALFENEIDKFVKQENINILAVENIERITIILCDQKNRIGYYHVSVDDRGFQIWDKSSSSEVGYSNPVSWEHHVALDPDISAIAYTIAIINDPYILRQAYKVNVKYSDNGVKEKILNNKKAIIIPYENLHAAPSSISVFDNSDNVIYKNP